MNLSASQCGSDCESGWTFYLDQSSCSQTGNFAEDYGVKGARFMVEDEEDGLSMVSDASSGPRQHCYCQENGRFCSHPATTRQPDKKSSRNKNKIKEDCSNNRHHSCLDDTASSPVISFSEKNFKGEASIELDFSQGFSGTHFKGKSASQKTLDFLKSGKTSSKHAGGFQERSRG
ncbi:protein SOB FIVE-LIKE 6-like [Hibiscus syriacus]|uniref:protein SOB FIVE-LIKE 6-like n=1 Tax=Hibiscus syriacus TaxID=106335 RepID=UPI001922997E|nr:protein SOB FIVE-LIKE 6-like [Hibiscus syriacus]